MNNTVFGKTMENVRKYENIKLSTIERRRNYYLVSELNYHTTKLFTKNLLGIEMRKTQTLIECNWTRAHNHLVDKRTLNHLAKLAKFYELGGCGFEYSCSHLNFRFRACFEQGVP